MAAAKTRGAAECAGGRAVHGCWLPRARRIDGSSGRQWRDRPRTRRENGAGGIPEVPVEGSTGEAVVSPPVPATLRDEMATSGRRLLAQRANPDARPQLASTSLRRHECLVSTPVTSQSQRRAPSSNDS